MTYGIYSPAVPIGAGGAKNLQFWPRQPQNYVFQRRKKFQPLTGMVFAPKPQCSPLGYATIPNSNDNAKIFFLEKMMVFITGYASKFVPPNLPEYDSDSQF